MSKKTIHASRLPDGTFVQVLEDGSEVPFPPRPPMPEMTDEEVEAAANSDPDVRPMTEEEWKKARPVPRIKSMRRAFRLTLEGFAFLYLIPVEILSDWEQGHSEPDEIMEAYLDVIATAPEFVQHILSPETKILSVYPVHPLIMLQRGKKTTAKLYPNDRLVEILEDESEKPFPNCLPKQSDVEARSKLNGHFPVEEGQNHQQNSSYAKAVRSVLGLTQEEFASYYYIPEEKVKDWEEGVVSPNQGECSYLKIIAAAPNFVYHAIDPVTEVDDDLLPIEDQQNGNHPYQSSSESLDAVAPLTLAQQNGAHPDEPIVKNEQYVAII